MKNVQESAVRQNRRRKKAYRKRGASAKAYTGSIPFDTMRPRGFSASDREQLRQYEQKVLRGE